MISNECAQFGCQIVHCKQNSAILDVFKSSLRPNSSLLQHSPTAQILADLVKNNAVIDSLSQPTTAWREYQATTKQNRGKKLDRDFVGAQNKFGHVWVKKGAEKKKESKKKLERQLFRPTFPLQRRRRRELVFWVVLIAGNRGEVPGFDLVNPFSTLLGRKLVRWMEMGVATLWLAA